MSRKRPTETTWDSDDDLLSGTGVSAFNLEKDEDDYDEAALLASDDEDGEGQGRNGGGGARQDAGHGETFEVQEDGEHAEETEDIITIDVGTGEEEDDLFGQEDLDYDGGYDAGGGGDARAQTQEVAATADFDTSANQPQNVSQEANEEQPDQSASSFMDHTAESGQAEEPPAEDSESESDNEEDSRHNRGGRFRTERSNNSIVTVTTNRSKTNIPDTLELSRKDQDDINKFNENKPMGSYRGGGRGRGGNYNNRGSYAPRPRHSSPVQNRNRTSQHFNNNNQPNQNQFQMSHDPIMQIQRPMSVGHIVTPFSGRIQQQQQPQNMFFQPQQARPMFQQGQHHKQQQQQQQQQQQPLIQQPLLQQQPLIQPAFPTPTPRSTRIHVNPKFQHATQSVPRLGGGGLSTAPLQQAWPDRSFSQMGNQPQTQFRQPLQQSDSRFPSQQPQQLRQEFSPPSLIRQPFEANSNHWPQRQTNPLFGSGNDQDMRVHQLTATPGSRPMEFNLMNRTCVPPSNHNPQHHQGYQQQQQQQQPQQQNIHSQNHPPSLNQRDHLFQPINNPAQNVGLRPQGGGYQSSRPQHGQPSHTSYNGPPPQPLNQMQRPPHPQRHPQPQITQGQPIATVVNRQGSSSGGSSGHSPGIRSPLSQHQAGPRFHGPRAPGPRAPAPRAPGPQAQGPRAQGVHPTAPLKPYKPRPTREELLMQEKMEARKRRFGNNAESNKKLTTGKRPSLSTDDAESGVSPPKMTRSLALQSVRKAAATMNQGRSPQQTVKLRLQQRKQQQQQMREQQRQQQQQQQPGEEQTVAEHGAGDAHSMDLMDDDGMAQARADQQKLRELVLKKKADRRKEDAARKLADLKDRYAREGKSLADIDPSLCGPEEPAMPANPISPAGPSTAPATMTVGMAQRGRGRGQPRGRRQGAVGRGGLQAPTQVAPIGGPPQPTAANPNQVKITRAEVDRICTLLQGRTVPGITDGQVYLKNVHPGIIKAVQNKLRTQTLRGRGTGRGVAQQNQGQKRLQMVDKTVAAVRGQPMLRPAGAMRGRGWNRGRGGPQPHSTPHLVPGVMFPEVPNRVVQPRSTAYTPQLTQVASIKASNRMVAAPGSVLANGTLANSGRRVVVSSGMSNTVVVNDLPNNPSIRQQLQDLGSKIGSVKQIKLNMGLKQATMEFYKVEDAAGFTRQYNGKFIDLAKVRVSQQPL